ncbi:hypothetical protein N1F91_30295, partial [Aquibium sp. ELW1220]|nr:hypothetical protein [Aquibium sp. ELW1220]
VCILRHGVISLAVSAAGWVGFVHPEITPPSNFHHLRDTTRPWRPVLYGHSSTGDIIAPIRDTTTADSRLDEESAADIARAIVAIRSHFMPNRARTARS